MPDAKAIELAIKNLSGAEKFLGRKEIKELPSILWEDELPEKIVQGFYNNGMGILVATNKRLIFIDKGIFSLKVEDFPYDKISSIQYSTGMLSGEIDIFTSGNKAEIKSIVKDQVRPFCEYVRARITKTAPHASMPQAQSTTSQDNTIDQLERLAKLKQQGILTEEEFQEQKRKILNS
ncbi:MAG TPA: PH domain-containing protein [Bacillota bacterium]|nr:PH domain-containing protein [Bacillota bacterium]